MILVKLDSDLRLFRMSNEKPNFAALAREYGVDYRTVKRHWMKGEMIITRNKSTIYFKGNKYSVDPALIGETVGYEEFDNKLHIYYNLKLVNMYDVVTGIKQIKYHEEH